MCNLCALVFFCYLNRTKMTEKCPHQPGAGWWGPMNNFTLHPLIHTLLKFNLAQDIESIKNGAETPHFLGLNPIYCSRLSKVKVGIKVCNSHSCICRIARLSPVAHCGAIVMYSPTLVLDLADCWKQNLFFPPYYNLWSGLWVLSK